MMCDVDKMARAVQALCEADDPELRRLGEDLKAHMITTGEAVAEILTESAAALVEFWTPRLQAFVAVVNELAETPEFQQWQRVTEFGGDDDQAVT